MFSFGVVLYEMLTGRQPFRGDTAAEVMASIMIRDADLAALPTTIHPRLREIITRCLDKQPRQRWQSMGDLRLELEALRAASPPPMTSAAGAKAVTATPLWKRLLPTAAAMMLTATGTAMLVDRWRPAPVPEVVRLTIPAADMRLTLNGLAIAPGGTAIAYAAVTTSGPTLMIRHLGEFDAKPIEATRGLPINYPTFSPDGASVAFASEQQIRRVDLRGGASITLCKVSQNVHGLSWRGSSLLFAAGNAIYRVADTGGEPEAIVRFESNEMVGLPQALDDEGTLLYHYSSGEPNNRDGRAGLSWQVILQTPSGRRTVVANDAVNASYVAPGRVVFVRNGTLMAVRVDLGSGQAIGGEVPVVEGITRLLTTAPTFHAAVSPDGALAYVPGSIGRAGRTRLGFVQMDGRLELLAVPPHFYGQPRLSPDGRQLAVESDDGKEAAVWVGPVAGGGSLRRLTFEGRNVAPIWTRDGQFLTFQSDREGDYGVFLQRADGSAPAVRLTRPDAGSQHLPESWSPDDRYLTLRVTKDRGSSIWVAARDGSELKPFAEVGERSLGSSEFSPDGRWVAYGSNEIKTYNIFVQPFPATGVKYQLTTDATSTPVWSRDGKQLYYAYTNRVFRAEVLTAGGMSLGPVTAVETTGSLPNLPMRRYFDVMPDGKRFLVVLPEGAEAAQRTTINVVLNWAAELNAKLPQ
jgi:Tol biopolymer transport system component